MSSKSLHNELASQHIRHGSSTTLGDEGKAFSTKISTDRQLSSSVVTDFVARTMELTVVARKISSGLKINQQEAAEFGVELSNFHCMTGANICAHFNTSMTSGLTNSNAAALLARDGCNEVSRAKELPAALKLLRSFFSGFSPLLWFASFFAFLSWKPFGAPPSNVYNLALAVVLLIVIFVSGLFTFYQEWQTSNVLEGFKTFIPSDCVVLRDGRQSSVSSTQLVLGDLVVLAAGVKVPADMRILLCSGLRIDKSILTGENQPVKLSAEPTDASVHMLQAANMAFTGCNIVEGQGVGVVISVGANTQLSRIVNQLASVTSTVSRLQVEINRFVVIIATLAALTMTLLMAYWGAYLDKQHNGFMTLSLAIANAIGALVAFVPEGLPLALSMGLTLIAKRLCSRYNVLVKYLPTVESLGCLSLIASDKTGTLTKNKMTITRFIIGERIIESLSESIKTAVLRSAVLCNQATVEIVGVERRVIGSNGIDKALLTWADQQGDADAVISSFPPKLLVPFNSTSKLTTVVVQSGEGEFLCIVKGAPEYVLASCSSYMDDDGRTVALSKESLSAITNCIGAIAETGERIIAIAQRVLHYVADYEFTCSPRMNFPSDALTLIGCVSVSDPPRDGVQAAIAQLRLAGIRISMVTGDAPTTALAIARQVGIVSVNADGTIGAVDKFASMRRGAAIDDFDSVSVDLEAAREEARAVAVEGRDLLIATDADWDYMMEYKELIFARVTPEQKLQIVKESQRRGFVVGVTGDGVNDSPALKCADVGIAMNAGSDVARDAAAIVLLTDDFNAIVHGVEEGRLVFNNLRKVIGYQISAGCYSELLPVLATFFLGMPQPLSSFLMIIISCMTDVYAGVALTTEPPESSIMLEPPRNVKTTRLVDLRLICYSYLFMGNLASFGSFFNYFHYMHNRGPLNVPDPIPADDDGTRNFPSGYSASQIFFAWNWGANSNSLGSDQSNAAAVASSVFFVALVVSQMGHLLSIRRKTPYFSDAIMGSGGGGLWARVWGELKVSVPRYQIVLAICLSALTANFFNEVPAVQTACGTGSVPALYWGFAFGWSALWFSCGELRKWIILLNPDSWLSRTAW